MLSLLYLCLQTCCELRLASLFAILHLVNDKIIEFRYSYFISFSFVSSIFWQLSDKTRHFVSIILSLLYLCLQTCYLWASACILVCDLTSSERQNNWISILLFHLIESHQYFDNCQIKLRRHFFSTILSSPIYTFACRLVIFELRLSSLFAILHLVNDKIIEFRYSYYFWFSFFDILTTVR